MIVSFNVNTNGALVSSEIFIAVMTNIHPLCNEKPCRLVISYRHVGRYSLCPSGLSSRS